MRNQEFIKIKKTSGKEVESNIGLMYCSPDGIESIEIDDDELIDFIKEQKYPLILSVTNNGSIEMEIYDDYRE